MSRALVCLAEDSGSVLRTHMVALSRHIHNANAYTQAKHSRDINNPKEIYLFKKNNKKKNVRI